MSLKEELEAQMREKQEREDRERFQQDVEDKDYLNYQAAHNAFGKSGGGAPLRDQYGNAVTERNPHRSGAMLRTHMLG